MSTPVPVLTTFQRVELSTQATVMFLRAVNLSEDMTAKTLRNLLVPRGEIDISIKTTPSVSKANHRPTATIAFHEDNDYVRTMKRPFVNHGNSTFFLEPFNSSHLHKANLSGIPNGHSEVDIARLFLRNGIRANYWHIPKKAPSSTLSAFLCQSVYGYSH